MYILPSELLLKIAGYCDFADVCALSKVNRQWNGLIGSNWNSLKKLEVKCVSWFEGRLIDNRKVSFLLFGNILVMFSCCNIKTYFFSTGQLGQLCKLNVIHFSIKELFQSDNFIVGTVLVKFCSVSCYVEESHRVPLSGITSCSPSRAKNV